MKSIVCYQHFILCSNISVEIDLQYLFNICWIDWKFCLEIWFLIWLFNTDTKYLFAILSKTNMILIFHFILFHFIADNYCSMQPEPGFCLAKMTRFYYDRVSKKCYRFQYGGCGGNGNNFYTERDCLSYCTSIPANGYETRNWKSNQCNFKLNMNAW